MMELFEVATLMLNTAALLMFLAAAGTSFLSSVGTGSEHLGDWKAELWLRCSRAVRIAVPVSVALFLVDLAVLGVFMLAETIIVDADAALGLLAIGLPSVQKPVTCFLLVTAARMLPPVSEEEKQWFLVKEKFEMEQDRVHIRRFAGTGVAALLGALLIGRSPLDALLMAGVPVLMALLAAFCPTRCIEKTQDEAMDAEWEK